MSPARRLRPEERQVQSGVSPLTLLYSPLTRLIRKASKTLSQARESRWKALEGLGVIAHRQTGQNASTSHR
jgi:hypothetical protein